MNNLSYKNKEWLIEQYINQQKSTCLIAQECGYSQTAIYKQLTKCDIPRRSLSEAVHLATANRCVITLELLERISGQLLGDAYLYPYKKYSARLSWGQKHKEYAQYIKDTLANLGMSSGNMHYYKNAYHFNTISYPELLPLRQKWYYYDETLKRNRKKVPRDLELTPAVCREWHLGDGGLNHPKNGRSYIMLSTYDFPIKEVNFLVEKLNNLGFKTTRQEKHNTIYISTKSTKRFLKYIGPCPVKCYEYKWNYQDNTKNPQIQSG